MSDSRRKFIITSASTLLGYLDDSKTSSKVRDCIESSKAVTTFLENENCSLLQVICSIPTKNNSTPEIVLSNKMRSDTVWDGKDFRCSQVLFVKLRPTPITDDNFAQVIMVSSMLDSPIHALYNATHRVYAPMLLRDKSWSTKMAPKMQKLLAVMDSGLGSLVRRGSSELADIHDKKAMASILVPSDEFDVWKMLANNRTNGESAQKFSEIFSGISSRFQRISKVDEMGDNLTMTLPDILELVDDTQNCLDDIWKADVRQSSQYPQHRMKHIFSVIASALARYVSSYLGSTDIWQGAYAEVASRLQEAILVCERWSLVTADLSGSFWPSCEEHPWEGAAYEEQHIKNLSERLESILKVRTTHEELLRLLSIQEQRELNVASAFDPFNASDLRPLHYNPYTKSRWEDAVAMHDRQLAPIEQHIASNLRKQISGMSEHPQQLLREFLRYRQLLGRRTIAKALHGERETLLAQLSAYVEQCDQDYESVKDQSRAMHQRESKSSANVSSGAPLGRNLPIVTNNIVWAKQCEARMRGLLTRSRHILSDLSLYDDFKGMIQELMEKLRTWRRNEFQNWVDATEYLLDDGELSLEVSGQLMEIDVDGELIVNYSEKLVRLLREVRQLEDLGHQVNSRIKGVASDGEKYYRYGVMLKKIANFYNSMGNQIVVTQKPMLLDALKRFENQLHRGNKRGAKKAVTWNNPRECQDFVEHLQLSANALSEENRSLRKIHMQLAVQTAELMNIDLLRQRDQWKSKWFDMRDKVSDLTRKYPTERMANWKLHWDHQLCKALEAGYCMGLESLNENMLEIKVELCFTQRRLEFRPAIEDIRTQYFRELRRFLAIPVAFDGFGNKAVYKSIEKENAESLIQVYKKAEDLFRRLKELKQGLELWVALGTVPDMDEYVEENVSSAAEYQVNFAMLKKRLKQSEKLPEFYKLDCINVSAAPFKSAVEDHIQRMSDALLLSLKRSVLRMVSTVEEFLDNGMQQLNSRPTSIEEIGLAQKAWGELSGSKKSIKMEMRRADERRKLLISVAGNRVDVEEVRVRLGRLPSRWENFEVAMEAFNDLVEEQRETLKGEIDMRIKEANESVEKLALRWHALKPQGEVNNWNPETIQGIFDSLEDWQEQMEEKVKEVNTLKNNCVHFDMPVPKFPTLTELQADMQETQESWSLMQKYLEEWEAFRVQDWINFRTRIYELSDFVQNWLPKVKTKKDVVSIHLKEVLGILKSALPALKFCKGDVPFNEVHWASLFRQLGIPKGTRLENLNAGHFLDRLEAVAKSDKFCRDLTARATGEVRIREAMVELKDWCASAELVLFEHTELGRTTMLLTEWKDLFTALGDNQSLLGSLKDSPYFRAFAAEASVFEKNFSDLDQILHNLNLIQRKWLYLEPIFGRGALPHEHQRFQRIDDEFRDIMSKVEDDKRVLTLCDSSVHPNLLSNVEALLEQLERCTKALADFLEQKREKMPRFYFIGDEDLLEILGQAKNPTVIQAHLKKLFQGVQTVEFNEDNSKIIAIKSGKGEVVQLPDPVPVSEETEEWLIVLQEESKNALQTQLVDCLAMKSLDMTRFASQVLCLSEIVNFTLRTEAAIHNGNLASLKTQLAETLQTYTSYDLTGKPLIRIKVKAMVLDLIHNMDVVDYLIQNGCPSINTWSWQKQLRFYMNKRDLCIAKMSNAQFNYTYEYQGNASKLVHTPLTDKCYLTLTQGMHQGYGGNPYGPAGTGKTESVKALGAALGRQVLVFNCDEGIDFQSMGRIFTGLVKCGAWGCFDEFNRLKEDQLSAVSQQIQLIQAAIKNKDERMSLLGRNIQVDSNAGIFVTLNPPKKGYGGRSKLPDNLKQLFRPVAMSRPDNELIANVILYSEGFKHAKELGKKICSLFGLSKELLSPQQHYDWGLRALKSILVTGGKLIQNLKAESGETTITETAEEEILIKSVRVNTLSKLTYQDASRFVGLCSDIFPNAKVEDIAVPKLEDAIRAVMEQNDGAFGGSLEFDEGQLSKMLQLKESLDQRMGCVIVGPSGCGKSTVWRVLKEAMIKCGQELKTYVMNPKSMPRELLLGHMDLDTREWFDGVLTSAAKQVVKEPSNVRSWIICDGDVDPEWIESLNSVLDDNHLLTLPSGERINFGPNVNFLFETHDLQFASPATISRMGMIFLSDEDVDVKRLVRKWLSTLPSANQLAMVSWIDDYFYRALKWVLDLDRFVVDTTMVGTVNNGLSHLENVTELAQFIRAIIRGLGGNLVTEDRANLATQLFSWANERPPDPEDPLNSVWDSKTHKLIQYISHAPHISLDPKTLRRGIVIPTAAYQRNVTMVGTWAENMKPFIIVGPEGSGKSALIEEVLGSHKNTNICTLHCNARTTAEHVIQKLRSSCGVFSTNTGRVLRPRDCERLVLFLKNINLSKPDKYNTSMLVAFLQQLCTFQGFYDDDLEFLGLDRVVVVCSINPATTLGRHQLSSRFTAIVNIAYMEEPTPDELSYIYTIYLRAALSGVALRDADKAFKQVKNIEKLASTMVKFYEQIRAKFTVDEHRHYLLTPRDLTNWVLGLGHYDLSIESLLDVVIYEARRLMKDRLVDSSSEKKFDTILSALFRKDWSHRIDLENIFFSTLVKDSSSNGIEGKHASEGKDNGEVLSGDENKESDMTEQSFRKLIRVSESDFIDVVKRGKLLYEREEKDLTLLLFTEVLEHISRVDRVLSRPGGSLLLVGRSGCGRKTTVQLCAFMQDIRFITPFITRRYSQKSFHVDLKNVLFEGGIEGRPVVFYLEDYHFIGDYILQSVNSLLSAGEISGLYTHEELEQLLSPLKEEMNERGLDMVYKTAFDYFVQRCRDNVHIALGMDHISPEFRQRCMSNPALFTRCSIQWFGEWEYSSMLVVPKLLMPDFLEEVADSDTLVQSMVDIHKSCLLCGDDEDSENAFFRRKTDTATPRDFMSFLETYLILYENMKVDILSNANRMEGGLAKLQEASMTVDELSKNAVQQRATLAEKQQEADAAMVKITEALELASERKSEVTELQTVLSAAKSKTDKRKGLIEEELSGIQPVLDAAKKAVGQIKSENLDEIRSLKTPPDPIRHVLSAVLTLLGINDTSWLSMRNFLGKRGVKDDILNFDTARITREMRKLVGKTMKKNPNSFEKKAIRRVSIAAAPLAEWVKANIEYSVVLETVMPLQEELDKANSELKYASEKLKSNAKELKTIQNKVNRLKKEFAQKTREAEQTRSSLEKTEIVLEKAETLLGKLSGEQSRWESTVKQLRSEVQDLPYRILLAAGFVTYLAKSDENIRRQATRVWTKITGLDSFDFRSVLSSESEQLTWKAAGLPSDNLTMENSIVILNSKRTPFIIDPSSAATSWLKGHLQKSGVTVECLPSQDPRFANQVELAVRFGKTLMLMEVDGVEPMLYPLVRRDFSRQGSRLVVQIGEKTIDFNEKFVMYMVTRNPNPSIPPDAASLITVVNFTVTKSGLEGQLLGATIQHEKPELEKQKSDMLQREESFKVQLASLEKDLLKTLAESSGNLLENQDLIDSLTQTKIKSKEIMIALEESTKASEELDSQRDVYLDFARDGAQLFFLVKQLQNINHMYQFSLQSYLGLFNATLDTKVTYETIHERLKVLTPLLIQRTLFYVGRSLFKADRQMWAIHLVHGMYPNEFEENEWEFFGGYLAPDLRARGEPKGFPSWAPRERASTFRLFSDTFPELVSRLELLDSDMWSKWSRSATCERNFPKKMAQKLSAFQRLLTVQVLRPDRLQSAMDVFACELLGLSSISPTPTNVSRLHQEESSCETPILFIVTTGVDPCKDLQDYAAQTVGEDNYFEMAMGGGTQDKAIRLLQRCAERGTWLCLKNLHLVIAWLPVLEKTLNSLHSHKNFRLWLTAESHDKFPTILVQQALKCTVEAPPGVKKNLQRTYDSWNEEFVSAGSGKRSQVMFLLAFIHAIVQERRNYIPQGWSEFYEFSLGDLRAATNVIESALKSSDTSGGGRESKHGGAVHGLWNTVHGMMENALYGGRVSNIFDMRVLKAYLSFYFSDAMLSGNIEIPSIGLSIPKSSNHGEYFSFIGRLPDSDAPSLFGLPANIERSAQRANSTRIIKDLKRLKRSSGEHSAFNQDVWRAQLGPVIDTWEKTLKNSKANGSLISPRYNEGKSREGKDEGKNNFEGKSKSFEGGAFDPESPVSQFVQMELAGASSLMHIVDGDLKAVKQVLHGNALLTPAIANTARCLMNSIVPVRWDRKWEGPETPQVYMSAVAAKCEAVHHWRELINSKSLLDSPLNLADLLHPGTFLNALRQETSRVTKCPLDDLKLISAWDRSLVKGSLKVCVEGLLLQGAVFTDKVLEEANVNDLELMSAPTCYIGFVPNDTVEPYGSENTLHAPLYYNTSRERLLTELGLPIKGQREKWILAGVALFLEDC